MEALIILVVAAALSAGVVWWAMGPTDGQRRKQRARVSRERSPGPERQQPASPPAEERSDDAPAEGFVLMPDGAGVPEDRPSRALSLLRLILTIAIIAALGVAAIALVGFLVKMQLDQYFAR